MTLREYITKEYGSVNRWAISTLPRWGSANANARVNMFDQGRVYDSTKAIIAKKCGVSKLEKLLG